MTENEAIEVIYDKIETCEFYFAEHDRYPEWCEYEFLEALSVAISAFEEIQRYREMDRKIREVYGDCDGLLEVVIDGLCKHSGVDIENPTKARLLTDEDVDKWDAYRQIGTVEECRKAKRFKEYFDELYGIGLEVANWHQNGDTEPFDNFYDAAIDWSEQNE